DSGGDARSVILCRDHGDARGSTRKGSFVFEPAAAAGASDRQVAGQRSGGPVLRAARRRGNVDRRGSVERSRGERAAAHPIRSAACPGHRCDVGRCRRARVSVFWRKALMMPTPLVGAVGVLALMVILIAGVPIGVALGITGFLGLWWLLGLEPALIKSGVLVFQTLSRYELGVLPLFLFMAHVCFAANASRDFFDAAARFLGHRRGGLALASVGACAGFGAVSGSSLATAATIGLVALPEMRKRGYSDALATGAVAAGGTLG